MRADGTTRVWFILLLRSDYNESIERPTAVHGRREIVNEVLVTFRNQSVTIDWKTTGSNAVYNIINNDCC